MIRKIVDWFTHRNIHIGLHKLWRAHYGNREFMNKLRADVDYLLMMEGEK